MNKPEVLNILSDAKYHNSASSLNPTIKWDYYDSDGDAQSSYRVKIGTARGKSDIVDTGTVSSASNEYLLPTSGYGSDLKYGLKYYVMVQVSNASGVSDWAEGYFFTTGNHWDSYADNITGWTLEFQYKMNATYASISSLNEDLYPHHDLEIKDGTTSMSLEFFVDRVLVKTSETATYFIDTTNFHLYRIIGEDDNVKLYVDGVLVIDVIGKNTIQTNATQLKISTAPNGLPITSTWGSFSVDTDGAFPPETPMTTSEISSLFFDSEEVVDFLFDKDTRSRFFVATNPEDISESGKIYSIAKNANREKYETRPLVTLEATKVMVDSISNKWVSTENEIFEIKGEKIGSYTYESELDEESNLISFSKVENCSGVCGVFNNFLRIDTSKENSGSVWYYETIKDSGNLWFTNVDNSNGWVVDARVRIANDLDASSESSGLIINDGKREETLYIFENKIRLDKSNIVAFYDFNSSFVDIRITGKNDDILIYVKKSGTWELLIDGSGAFIEEAQLYADSGSHSSGPLYGHRAYSVWHANKFGSWQIYLSEYNGSTWSPDKQLTFDDGNCSNPSLFVDSSNVAHIVYQDNQFGNNEIVYVKYNGYGIYEKTRITDSVGDSIRPKIVVDSSKNVYLAWLDNRSGNYHVYTARYSYEENKWYSSHHDESDVKISGFGSAYNATTLSMSTNGTKIALVWGDDRNTTGNIYFSYYGTRGWVKEKLASNSSYGAINPDIAINNDDEYHIVWQDLRYGNDQIYYVKYTSSFLTPVRISNTSGFSKYPTISIFNDTDEDINILWLEEESENNTIRMKRTVGGSFRTSDDVFQTASFNNIFSINTIVFPSKKELQIEFTSKNAEGYRTVYSVDLYVPKEDADMSTDISSSVVAISNSKNTKAISFGNISSSSLATSEWYFIKYYTESSVAPIRITSWLFDEILDFYVDSERNLYTIDNSGLQIYSMILSGNSLVKNEHMTNASISAPPDLKIVFVNSQGNIFVASDTELYYHYHLSSPLVDTDNEWMAIDLQYSLGNIISINEDTEDGKIWIGFEDGAVAFTNSGVFVNNTISTSNSTEFASGYKVNDFSFSEQYVWMATDGGIVKINRQNNSETVFDVDDGLMDQEINVICHESDNVVWVVGSRGLVKVSGETVTIYRNKLSSNYINAFDMDEDNFLWLANNIGVEFFNTVLDTTYLIDEEDGLVSNSTLTNYKAYKVITDDDFDRDFYHIVKVNGVYKDSSLYYFDDVNKLIIFDVEQTSSSIVQLIYFQYVRPLFDLSDSSLLLEISTSGARRLTGLAYGDSNSQILASFIVDGDSYVYKFSGSDSLEEGYPFGTIIYDKTPPLGTIDIVDQISANQVVLAISATDNVSGVENMIVSKYSNFTTDGSTLISPIPFSESMNYDLGYTVGAGVKSHDFSSTTGSVLHIFERSSGNELQIDLLAGSSNTAQIYKFDKTEREWNNVENLAADQILCMATYLGKVYVGTGDFGKIFVSSDGDDYSLLTQLTDSYVYSLFSGSDDKLYIGTGTSGKFYSYNGSTITLLFDFNETGIYDICEFSGFIYMATGEKGRIYRYNMANGSVEIVFDDSDTRMLSIGVGKDYGSNSDTVYVGTNPNGKILRLISSRDFFVKSFESVYTNCYSIKQFSNSTDGSTNDLYACVDYRLLKLGNNSWSVVYIDADNDDIKDVALFNNEIFIISEGSIKALSLNVDKYVYIKFIDYAGNETVLYNDDGDLKPRTDTERLYDILTADDISGFSLKNRILVVDDNSYVTKTVVGNRPFLSAGKIDEETAVYVSEIFNGTNNLISWDTITYSGSIPTNTSITIQIRSSEIESAIDGEDWSDAISSGQSINGMSGQYIQFRAILSSTIRGITPVLNNVTITSKSTFAVHYFTTNFVLTSNLKSGILTANTVVPTGTEIIFGVTSSTSTDWNDYQVIEPNKVFYTDSENSESNIKVGVKFLSSTQDVAELHEFGIMFTTESGELIKLNLN